VDFASRRKSYASGQRGGCGVDFVSCESYLFLKSREKYKIFVNNVYYMYNRNMMLLLKLRVTV